MARTPSQVAAWAQRQKDNNSGGWKGMCLKFCRMAAGAPGGVYDAHTAWARARHKHPGDRTVPRGGFVYYRGGKHGHIAVSAGDGDIYSNDIVEIGKIDRVPLSRPESKWGQRYLGWSSDVNGVNIIHGSQPKPGASGGKVPAKKPKPLGKIRVNGQLVDDIRSVSIKTLLEARKAKNASRNTWYVQKWLNKVMSGTNIKEDGKWDAQTQALFDRFRREKLKLRGSEATGAPGLWSVGKLNDMAKSAKTVRSGK